LLQQLFKPNERASAEVQMLKKHNKELVNRLDDTNIRFEKLLQQGSLQKEALDIKVKLIDTLQRELQASNRASMICLDKASCNNKYAILGQHDEVQYKSLKDALSARHSINENQSYSNIVGSCLASGIGNMNQYDARIKEFEHLLKEKTDELENVKEQHAINSDIILKLRRILQDRNIEIENAETQNQQYLERVKSLEDKVLSLEKAKKDTNDKELTPRQGALMKKVEEQAKEKYELQKQLKDIKEKFERTQSPSVENQGLISHSSGESCCIKDEFTSHEGNFTNIGKENSCKIMNVVRKLKKSILNFHVIVRNEIEKQNIFSHLPSLSANPGVQGHEVSVKTNCKTCNKEENRVLTDTSCPCTPGFADKEGKCEKIFCFSISFLTITWKFRILFFNFLTTFIILQEFSLPILVKLPS
jgi:hypothetical protein